MNDFIPEPHRWTRIFGVSKSGENEWQVWENYELEITSRGERREYPARLIGSKSTRADALDLLPKEDQYTEWSDRKAAIITIVHECPRYTVSAASQGFNLPGVFDVPSCYEH